MVRCNTVLFMTALCGGLLVAGMLPAQTPFGNAGGFGLPSADPARTRSPYRPKTVRVTGQGPEVLEVRVVGYQSVPEEQIRQKLQTKVGRNLDSELLQSDVRELIRTGLFRNVQPFTQEVDGGVIVTYQVTERSLIREIRFQGNKKLSAKKLLKKCDLTVGSPLAMYRIEETRRQIEEFYHEQGFAHARVFLSEDDMQQTGVVTFRIVEGPKQRILRTVFVGNTIDSDARLRTQIKSKPGILWLLNGQLNQEQIDADVERLTAYYRRLGYFQAHISRELEFSQSEGWVTIRFVINEGPRYRIRRMQLVGNEVFSSQELLAKLRLKEGDYFDMVKMSTDANTLWEAYGAQGYIQADIEPEPRFLEEPGQLDLVYHIKEGELYYVDRILVNIQGEYPHTRENVVLNQLSQSPGDIVNMRELKMSERRLSLSQLFETNPAVGSPPQIRVVPADGHDLERTAGGRRQFGAY